MDRIEKGNYILSHFMGIEYSKDLNYHEDYNKLMDVWKKLVSINPKSRRIMDMSLFSEIETAWSIIVGYINKNILTEEEYKRIKAL